MKLVDLKKSAKNNCQSDKIIIIFCLLSLYETNTEPIS